LRNLDDSSSPGAEGHAAHVGMNAIGGTMALLSSGK
jgi:hypothetical protein